MFAIFLFALTLIFVYVFTYDRRNYWTKRGVPSESHFLPYFGNIFAILLGNHNIGKYLKILYHKYETPYFGFVALNQPYLVLRDPKIIKRILIKDFHNFPDRIFHCDSRIDPIMSYSLLGIKNPQWRLLRNSTTPIFSSGRIKAMLPLISECAQNLSGYLGTISNKSVEAGEITAKYTTDVIASCAFGIKSDSFGDENGALRVAGRRLTKSNFWRSLAAISYSFAHVFVRCFRLKFFESEATEFMTKVFKETINQRERSGAKRNDLIDFLIQLKNKESSEDEFQFDDEKIVAPALMFFLAGYDATSSTMSFILHELCVHEEIQEKLRKEIAKVVESNGGITYEALNQMSYLDQVICEILRLHTFTPFLQRKCLNNYTLPETGLLIEKGTNIIIPQHGLHSDSKYFEEPEKFNPDRFSLGNARKMQSCVYLPFGEGPRGCVGERFAMLNIKIGLAHLLKNFAVERNEDTKEQLTFGRSDLLRTGDGVRITFRKIV